MLRYIFLKLSGFTSKKEFSISSSCNQMLMFRNLTGKETEREGRKELHSRPPHKRSYSFPSRGSKSNRFLDNHDSSRWSKTDIEGPGVNRTKSLHHALNRIPRDAGTSSSKTNRKYVDSYSTGLKRALREKSPVRFDYQDIGYIDEADRYELEAARPRKSQSELIFNVFDYVARDVDLTDYLQPSNLKPFGSNENMYLPVLTSHKNLCLDPHTGAESLDEYITEKCLEHVRQLDNVQPSETQTAPKKEEEYWKPYKELIRKHKSLTPKAEKVKAVSSPKKIRSARKAPLERAKVEEPASTEALLEPLRQKFSFPITSVRIDPPPFLAKDDDVFSTISFGDMNRGGKKDHMNYTRVQAPFPAYSDHVKHFAKKTSVEHPAGEKTEGSTDTPKPVKEFHSADNLRAGERPKAPVKPEPVRNALPQRRALSMEHVKSTPPMVQQRPHTTSSKSKNITKNPVSQSLLSLCRKGVSFCPSHNYGKSCKYRTHEPGSCNPPTKAKKKCFLPSKVRLVAPRCISFPLDCPKPRCPPRADACLTPRKKKLPRLKDSPCECFEPVIPDKNPKLKRLPMFYDEGLKEDCPCEVKECPCELPIRADQNAPPKEKRLRPYKPGKCECVDTPPMVDVPLVRLVRCPILECPREPCQKHVCGDTVRADECAKVRPTKPLPILVPKPCPCIERKMTDVPKLKRLNLQVEEPPQKVCPESLCPPTECFRVDACEPEKVKKLQPLKAKDCPCIESRMLDVKPLPRLKCVEEPCICMPCDPCGDNPRADLGCWEYLQEVEVEPANKGDSKKKKNKKGTQYKQKRRYNTNSTTRIANCTIKADENDNDLDLNGKSALNTTGMKHSSAAMAGLEKHHETPSTAKLCDSLSTLYLLRNLGKLGAAKANHDDNCSSPHFPPPLRQGSHINAYIRQLSTSASKTNLNKVLFSSSTKNSSEDPKKSKDAKSKSGTCKKKCEKKEACPKLSKCPKFIMKTCPLSNPDTHCPPKRKPVCCEKKIVPNPAFSECMDEEVEPFSNTSQWRCERKEYGFDPNPKKAYEPLDTVKDKKKFCTLSTHCTNSKQKGENAIVSYFAARYLKPETPRTSKENIGPLSDAAPLDCSDGLKREVSATDEIEPDDSNEKAVKKELPQAEEHSSKLLGQKATSLTPASSRKMSTHDSVINRACPPDARPLSDKKCCGGKYDEGKKEKPECKKKCPKFLLENCPEKLREDCRVIPDKVCHKLNAPYPSFSELMDNEMEDKLSECPMARNKVQALQPKYPITAYDNSEMISQEGPQQGRIDPKLEEKCIHEKLCLENEGLSQDCSNFGSYIKPLKSKNFFRDRNVDCETIEELRKLGKWPPKKSPTATAPDAGGQKRKMCSSMHGLKPAAPSASRDQSQKENLKMENNKYARSFHVLCSKANPVERTYRSNQPTDTDNRCKYMKLRNVQWRIDNFQKWHGLRKTSGLTYFSKRFHTCSKLKYRRFVKPTKKSYLTHKGGKVLTWEVIPFKWKNLSAFAVKTPVDNTNALVQRGISTTMSLGKSRMEKCVRYPIYQKKVRKKPSKISMEMGTLIQKPILIRPLIQKPILIRTRMKKKHTKKPRKKHEVKSLQPRYPSLPEIDTVPRPTTYPYKDDLEQTGKGHTYDCSALETPFINLHRNATCKPCGEAFLHVNKRGRFRFQSCPKIPTTVNCVPRSNNCMPKPDNSVPEPDNCQPEPDNCQPEPDNCQPEHNNCQPEPDNCQPKHDKSVPRPNSFLPVLWERLRPKSCAQKAPNPYNSVRETDNSQPKCDNNVPKPDDNVPKLDKCEAVSWEPPKPCFQKTPKPCKSAREPDNSETKSDKCVPKPDKCVPKPENCVPEPNKCVPAPKKCVPAPNKCVPALRDCSNPCAQKERLPQPCSSVPPQSCPENANFLLNMWRQIVQYFRAKPNCPPPHEWKQKALRERAEKAAKAAGLCLCDPKDLPRNVSNKPDGQQCQSATNNKTNGCFPANRANPCKVTSRNYSSGIKWKSDDKRKPQEGEKEKHHDDDAGHVEDATFKCPDPALESILKTAILDRNSLSCLDRSATEETSDNCLCPTVNVLPNELNILDDYPKDDLNRYDHSKPISDFPEYAIKTDNFSEITYEEMEKVKTNTLVNELDKLLEKSQNSQKKN